MGLFLTGLSAVRIHASGAPLREILLPLGFTAIAGGGLVMFLLMRRLLQPLIDEQLEHIDEG